MNNCFWFLQISEWGERAEKFHSQCGNVSDMFVRLAETPNRALLYDLYPYVWDVKEIVLLLDTFITWLGSKNKKKKQKTGFYPEDPEPWVFRGGICADLQVGTSDISGVYIKAFAYPDFLANYF